MSEKHTTSSTDIAAARETMSVRIGGNAVEIAGSDATGAHRCLKLSPGEALMLLDILQNESKHLDEMAAEAAPIQVRFDFRGA